MATGGISDKIQVLEESAYGDGGAAGEVVFGVTKTFSWQTETSTNQSYGLETDGPSATVNVDGVLQVTGTHEWEFTDGRELKAIFGSLPTNTGGNYTLDVAASLPSYSVKAVDGDNFIIIKGLKYTKISMTLTSDETVIITADWLAQTVEDEATFTPTVTAIEPLTYLDGCFSIAGTELAEVESISLDMDRQSLAKRFIQCPTTGERRLITTIIDGPLALAFSGEVGAQRLILEEIFGSTTLQDERSDVTLLLRLARGTVALDLTITGGRFTSAGRTLDKTAEVALQDFAGVALDISGSGTYAV
jgi:hypothetical protein